MILADNQIAKIVGLSAPKDFRDKIHDLASRHDGILEVDAIRAYHLGLKFFVEIDVVMPGSMPLFNSHDAALGLQKKVRDDISSGVCLNGVELCGLRSRIWMRSKGHLSM